ncbi:MarR family transcriptional regulator [Clostridium sp. CM028]|uniref:MarR family transcriptional regulator n=1 Tax=unclassified Clostridium TaxID=2614128 RepID=UPI001C6DF4D7|nr:MULTISPECIES: MarR family transcriptional regulator [unclassified Clostridium]MBW9144971.1 MarR family transcriptional regulator [Clostridium sp. CM027]MBW9148619.1 MarR family transcriptional regulator [Clostridium sp. CM028]UVE40108.1 MarR family transcriptional regulator [Clostridium sp. CM027]WLC60789.1 MarR family transcriptional regulator [Clostridium sp. CM028]
MDINKIEQIIFNHIDEFKVLFFPEQWSDIFLDFSKNEILALLFLHRKKNANMTEIAEYINAPLNTATGVIARLEKKLMVERIRSAEDRRIVLITLTEVASTVIEKEKAMIVKYFIEIYGKLTEEEISSALSIYNKVLGVFKGIKNPVKEDVPVKKLRKIIIE